MSARRGRPRGGDESPGRPLLFGEWLADGPPLTRLLADAETRLAVMHASGLARLRTLQHDPGDDR